MHLVLLASTTVKFLGTKLGSKMGVRLLLLLVVGLGALYTIHLLAQDWMKISAGTRAGKVKLIFKYCMRQLFRILIDPVGSFFGKRDIEFADQTLEITKEEVEFEQKIDWDKILRRDPFNCALSLVCQLSAGAGKDNKEANEIYEFIS